MTSDEDEKAKHVLKALDVKRKALEMEMAATLDELTAPSADGGAPMGVDTPLTDTDGYPRADIDIYRARNLRHRLAVIKTDHQALLQQVEAGLTNVSSFHRNSSSEDDTDAAERQARLAPKPKPKFDAATGKWVVKNWDGSVAGVPDGETRSFDNLTAQPITDQIRATLAENLTVSQGPAVNVAPPVQEEVLAPFAVIDGVMAGSPAQSAGLHEGDLVVTFGTAHRGNHRNLKAIAEMVPLAAGDHKEIPLKVLRRTHPDDNPEDSAGVEAGVHTTIQIKLQPRPWAGRGLLGCHIKAYTDPSDYREPSV